jgi:hypothetical protein
MKVKFTSEVDIEDMLNEINACLERVKENQIRQGCMLVSVLDATIAQNTHLIKMLQTEPY